MDLKSNMCIEYIIVNPTKVFGGGEVYLLNLLQSIPELNRPKFLVLAASPKLSHLLRELGYRVECVEDSTQLSINTFKLIRKVRSLLRIHPIKAVLLNGLPEIGVHSRFINFSKVIVSLIVMSLGYLKRHLRQLLICLSESLFLILINLSFIKFLLMS